MNCQICGKPSGYLPLCKSCFKLKDEEKVIKCPVCDKWRKTDEVCPSCGNKPIRIVENTTQQESNVDPITCLICGENSNGKHFCRSCYFKYKDRSIDIRITNCNSTQLLDEFGTRTKKAKDGRYVRSLSEKIIIDYFFDNYIRVVYEKTIPYVNEKGEEKQLHPDFYLTDYDLYIEFNGLTNKAYLKKKDYANKIYKEKGLKVEILESNDIDDIEATMAKLLTKYPKR